MITLMTDTVIERRSTPQWLDDRITSKGGLNQYGQPNFRVIWGGNRTYLVGGMFNEVLTVKDDEGRERSVVTRMPLMKTLLKYHPFRWHLERWRGPEFYGDSEEWYRNSWDEEAKLHVMGDYPAQGDYEHVFFLAQCPHMKPGDADWCMHCQVGMGEYIPLEPNVHILEMQIYALQKSEDVTKSAQFAALFMRENIKRQVRNKEVGERVRGAMRPKLAVQPTSWQSGMGSKCSVPEPKVGPRVKSRRNEGFRQGMPTVTRNTVDIEKEN